MYIHGRVEHLSFLLGKGRIQGSNTVPAQKDKDTHT